MITDKESKLYFSTIVTRLFEGPFSILDAKKLFYPESGDSGDILRSLNSAFLMALSNGLHSGFEASEAFLQKMKFSAKWKNIAEFYLLGIDLIHKEIDDRYATDKDFKDRVKGLFEWLSEEKNSSRKEETREKIWALFFPEALGILKERETQIRSLREKRHVEIMNKNGVPITEPAMEMLFTSNVLLTTPSDSFKTCRLTNLSGIKEKLDKVMKEEQIYWYDHPIQIGVKSESNEFIYGLKGLQKACLSEIERGNLTENGRINCLLSVSVTHKGLHDIARTYLEEELRGHEKLPNLNVYVVTEKDTQKLLNEIIGPAGKRYLNSDSKELFEVFGVDGEYGRHYSFLKAVSLLWNILIDRKVRGTFKIDLDQIFPQERLIQETGKSAFEHFRTDLWGAEGVDSTGRRIELGMVAGALVNDRDIINGLYTPDILFPQENPDPDEYIFYSRLPQALSTEAEMMTRYGQGGLNGDTKCIERIHVTGGTNGILIKSLERFRPFTPSFIGRAEDQAYIMSAVTGDQDRLACLHRDGLFMRHDKESFAGEAIKSAGLGKIISDCIRILSFSSYARVLTKDLTPLKDLLDPFTGCFISKIPVTLVYLRFALRGAGFFEKGETGQGTRFIVEGSTRLNDAIKISLDDKAMKEQYDRERIGWNMYYNTLSAIERNLVEGEEFAMGLRQKALEIFEECRLKNQDD